MANFIFGYKICMVVSQHYTRPNDREFINLVDVLLFALSRLFPVNEIRGSNGQNNLCPTFFTRK